METKVILAPLVSLVSAAVAAYAAYLTRKVSLRVHEESLAFQRQQVDYHDAIRRQDRVFQLFRIWSSGEMHVSRANGWSWLHDLQDGSDGKIYLGLYRQSQSKEERQQYYWVSNVSHFFADLNTMIEQEALDMPLVREVFGHTILHWFLEFDKTDLGCSADDNSNESSVIRNWWMTHVHPLREKLEEAEVGKEVEGE